MDKGILQRYSTWAKENLENQIEVSLKALGINSETDIRNAKKAGDVTIIDGDQSSYPADLYEKRKAITSKVNEAITSPFFTLITLFGLSRINDAFVFV